MGEKMGGPEILATAKGGVLGKVFVIEGGLEILNRWCLQKHHYSVPIRGGHPRFHGWKPLSSL